MSTREQQVAEALEDPQEYGYTLAAEVRELAAEVDRLKTELIWATVECGYNHGNGACLSRERHGKCNCALPKQLRELREAAMGVAKRAAECEVETRAEPHFVQLSDAMDVLFAVLKRVTP